MPLAFLGADAAAIAADLEHAPQDVPVGAGAARSQRGSGKAEIGAIEIEPDALHQLPHVAFRETGDG